MLLYSAHRRSVSGLTLNHCKSIPLRRIEFLLSDPALEVHSWYFMGEETIGIRSENWGMKRWNASPLMLWSASAFCPFMCLLDYCRNCLCWSLVLCLSLSGHVIIGFYSPQPIWLLSDMHGKARPRRIKALEEQLEWRWSPTFPYTFFRWKTGFVIMAVMVQRNAREGLKQNEK